MSNEHDYRLHLAWAGDPAVGTATYAAYDRTFRIDIAGKPALVGSADPKFRGAADLHNPEDLFLSALASCHMLAYLALCARSNICVVAYVDDAHGQLVTPRAGGGRFERVTLRPRVQVATGSDVARALELHREAHERCFIASSCSVAFDCDPVVTALGDAPLRVAAPSARTDAAPDRPSRQDLAVRLADRPGALAALGETLGRAGISLEGGGGFSVAGACVVHFLVREGDRAATVLRAAGIEVLGVRDVVELRLAQDEPGQLGKLARAMADAGVNIDCVYSDHDHHLIVCVDDLDTGKRVAARWQSTAPQAPRLS